MERLVRWTPAEQNILRVALIKAIEWQKSLVYAQGKNTVDGQRSHITELKFRVLYKKIAGETKIPDELHDYGESINLWDLAKQNKEDN